MKRSSAKQVQVRADAATPHPDAEKPAPPSAGNNGSGRAALAAAVSSCGSHADSVAFTAGIALVVFLSYALGAAPSFLPLLFLAFAASAGPLRIASFVNKRWTFFLVDMCYVSIERSEWLLTQMPSSVAP